MNRLLGVVFVPGMLLLLLPAEKAMAQPNGYQRPPVVSPYLDLLGGNLPGVNYYLRVLPELKEQNSGSRLNLAYPELERSPASSTDPGELIPTLPGTGHAARFMNYGSYYNFSTTPRLETPLPGPRRP